LTGDHIAASCQFAEEGIGGQTGGAALRGKEFDDDGPRVGARRRRHESQGAKQRACFRQRREGEAQQQVGGRIHRDGTEQCPDAAAHWQAEQQLGEPDDHRPLCRPDEDIGRQLPISASNASTGVARSASQLPRSRSRTSVIWWHTLDRSDREPTFTGTSAPDRTGQTEMSDGPTPDDFRAKVFRDRRHTEDWRVEKKMDEDGSSEIAIFSGPAARERAVR
jgi:hypothetical protein